MQVLAGFIVGYLVGTRDGRQGLIRLIESWESVSTSEEFKAAIGTALTVGADVLRKGAGPAVTGRVGDALIGAIVDRASTALGGGRAQLRAVS